MSKKNLIISVVTPSFDQGKFISETIESVIYQEGEFFIDYIIMDGGSKDNTIKIIEKYIEIVNDNEFDLKCNGIKIRYFSNKDDGQADAINKGFKIANGNIYSFLNSDDIYEAETFKKVSLSFYNNPNIDIVYGNAFYIDQNSHITGIYPSRNIQENNIFKKCFICQPTLFMKREVYNLIGPFNKSINNSFDYEYWLRIYSSNKFNFYFLRNVLASSRMHKENKTTINRKEIYYEYFSLMNKYSQVISKNWKIGFARETSYLAKILLTAVHVIKTSFGVIIAIYSRFYFWLHRKRIR